MGHPILGTRDSIGGMSRDDVFDYYKKMYNAENLIVCVAGNASHDEVVALAEKWLKPFKVPRTRISSQRDTKDLRLGHGPSASKRAKALKRFTHIVQKPAEQVHVLMGLPASSFRDKLRFEAYIVNSLLGGGMTSRLYQSIREDRGLAYSVYSMLSTFFDSGTIMVYAATDTKSSRKVVDLMVKELKRLKSRGVSRADLELYKTQVTGQILLGADDLENRMNSLGANEMVFGKYRPIDDVMKEIGTVTQDSVQEYLDKHLDLDRMGLLLMGAVDKESKKWTNEIL